MSFVCPHLYHNSLAFSHTRTTISTNLPPTSTTIKLHPTIGQDLPPPARHPMDKYHMHTAASNCIGLAGWRNSCAFDASFVAITAVGRLGHRSNRNTIIFLVASHLIDKSRDYFGLRDLEKYTRDGGVLNIHIGIIVDLFAEGKVLPQLEQVL